MVSPFLTTPSALSKEASRYFFDAQPPLLYEEGTICSEIGFVAEPIARCRNADDDDESANVVGAAAVGSKHTAGTSAQIARLRP